MRYTKRTFSAGEIHEQPQGRLYVSITSQVQSRSLRYPTPCVQQESVEMEIPSRFIQGVREAIMQGRSIEVEYDASVFGTPIASVTVL